MVWAEALRAEQIPQELSHGLFDHGFRLLFISHKQITHHGDTESRRKSKKRAFSVPLLGGKVDLTSPSLADDVFDTHS